MAILVILYTFIPTVRGPISEKIIGFVEASSKPEAAKKLGLGVSSEDTDLFYLDKEKKRAIMLNELPKISGPQDIPAEKTMSKLPPSVDAAFNGAGRMVPREE